MIKKIKKFFRERKEKKIRPTKMQIEVLETLATICLYLEYDGHYSRNRYSEYLHTHYSRLKVYSSELQSDILAKMVGDDNGLD